MCSIQWYLLRHCWQVFLRTISKTESRLCTWEMVKFIDCAAHGCEHNNVHHISRVEFLPADLRKPKMTPYKHYTGCCVYLRLHTLSMKGMTVLIESLSQGSCYDFEYEGEFAKFMEVEDKVMQGAVVAAEEPVTRAELKLHLLSPYDQELYDRDVWVSLDLACWQIVSKHPRPKWTEFWSKIISQSWPSQEARFWYLIEVRSFVKFV